MRKGKKITSPMEMALSLAREGLIRNEIPVGCVIVDSDNNLISYASNMSNEKNDPTAHAEILAIRKACKKLKSIKLNGLNLYTTLEPCRMCESLIIQTGIKRIYFGAYSNFIESHDNKMKKYYSDTKKYEYFGGISEDKCSNLLFSFFRKLRD